MPRLSETFAQLAGLRRMSASHFDRFDLSRLDELHDFGSNPGALTAQKFIPENVRPRALVVVLHGCTQTASAYDLGSGWSEVAERYGFALLFPEQRRQNNPNLCFNWFSPEDAQRGSGEALSIRQMIATMIEQHGIDPAQVYITGLSAGGAMTSVMLATYPEVFAGGAIIAGLPFGSAHSIPQALERMRGHGLPDEAELVALVHRASDHQGDWPTISVWHGTADAIVNPTNAEAILDQWRAVHGVTSDPALIEAVDGYPRRVWRDAQGREVIEEYSIMGLGHGTPLKTTGSDGCGRSGPHMFEARISSTHHICNFWGLTKGARVSDSESELRADQQRAMQVPALYELDHPKVAYKEHELPPKKPSAASGVGKIIEDALRTAGLMR